MGKMQIFENSEFGKVRGGLTKSGKPWFVAKDVADILGYRNGSRDINRHVKEKDRHKVMLFDGNQKKETIIINESGLYTLILRSKLESAEKFQYWVTSEVLPSIRKNGGYIVGQENNLSDTELIAKALVVAQGVIAEREKRIANLSNEIEHKNDVINGLTEDISLAEKRQRIIQIIRHHVTPSQIATRWGLLYSEFNKKYHCNVKLRFERQREEFDPKLKNPLDYIERGMDMIPELYELACKLFESDIDSLLEEWSTTISREDFIY